MCPKRGEIVWSIIFWRIIPGNPFLLLWALRGVWDTCFMLSLRSSWASMVLRTWSMLASDGDHGERLWIGLHLCCQNSTGKVSMQVCFSYIPFLELHGVCSNDDFLFACVIIFSYQTFEKYSMCFHILFPKFYVFPTNLSFSFCYQWGIWIIQLFFCIPYLWNLSNYIAVELSFVYFWRKWA